MKFSEIFKSLREEKDLKQTELAKDLQMTSQALSQYERGLRTPDVETLNKIAEYFDVSTDYLIGRTNIKNTITKVDTNKYEKDVEEILENTMNDILDQEGLMLNGEILTDNDLILLKKAIKTGIEYAKSMKTK